MKLYDHDVSYLQDAKNRLMAAQHGHKEHNKMFVDILVNNSHEESEYVLPTDLKQLEDLLGTEIDRN